MSEPKTSKLYIGRTIDVQRDANGKPLLDKYDKPLPPDVIDEIPDNSYCVDVYNPLFYYVFDGKKFFQWRNLPNNPDYKPFKILNLKSFYYGKTMYVPHDANGKPLIDRYDEPLPPDIIDEIPAGSYCVDVRRHKYEYYLNGKLYIRWRNLPDDPWCARNKQTAEDDEKAWRDRMGII